MTVVTLEYGVCDESCYLSCRRRETTLTSPRQALIASGLYCGDPLAEVLKDAEQREPEIFNRVPEHPMTYQGMGLAITTERLSAQDVESIVGA